MATRPDMAEIYSPISAEIVKAHSKEPLTSGYQACQAVEETFWGSVDLESVRGRRSDTSCYCFGPDALTWSDHWVFVGPSKRFPQETLCLGIEMLDKGVGEIDLAQAHLAALRYPFGEFLKRKIIKDKVSLSMLATDHLRNTVEGITPEDNVAHLSVEVYDPESGAPIGSFGRNYSRTA